jgi:hypothetical protein
MATIPLSGFIATSSRLENRRAGVDAEMPQRATTDSGLDTREVSLEAPAGTPPPLREVYEAIAQALFDASEMRRCPPTARGVFEDQARSLSRAWRASWKKYTLVELQLQAEAESGGCAHQGALNAICRVNDACGHVMRGSVPFDQVTEHLQSVPTLNVAKLLRAMRRQTSRAALRIQPIDRSIHVSDGKESRNEGKLQDQKEQRRTKQGRERNLEARDKWIYQMCCKGIPYKEIRAELGVICQKKGWKKIASVQGIRAAAMSYAEGHDLPKPPFRMNL